MTAVRFPSLAEAWRANQALASRGHRCRACGGRINLEHEHLSTCTCERLCCDACCHWVPREICRLSGIKAERICPDCAVCDDCGGYKAAGEPCECALLCVECGHYEAVCTCDEAELTARERGEVAHAL